MEDFVHHQHGHRHGAECGHLGIAHEDHVDYVHDGHLHNVHGDHVDEHELAVTAANPDACAGHACDAHAPSHVHGVACGHEALPHAGHIDYVVDGHLHRRHGEHCDDHGVLARV